MNTLTTRKGHSSNTKMCCPFPDERNIFLASPKTD